MTYILGYIQPGMSAIISDLAATRTNRQEWGYACKSGVLFPGCIYGISGNSYEAIRFIEKFQDIYLYEEKSLDERWNEFVEHTKYYEYSGPSPSSRAYFEMIISVRVSGSPQLFRLLSGYGLQECPTHEDGGFYFMGSGSSRLTEYMQRWVAEVVALARVELESTYGWTREEIALIISYLTCQLLSDKTLGYEANILEQVGVGGIFHFLYQTKDGDFTQRPTVFLHFEMDDQRKRGVAYWSLVLYSQYGLIFQTPLGNGLAEYLLFYPDKIRALVDEAGEEAKIKPIDRQAIIHDLERQPFYYYCGIGSLDTVKRQATGFIVKEDGVYGDLFTAERAFEPNFDRVSILTILGTPIHL